MPANKPMQRTRYSRLARLREPLMGGVRALGMRYNGGYTQWL